MSEGTFSYVAANLVGSIRAGLQIDGLGLSDRPTTEIRIILTKLYSIKHNNYVTFIACIFFQNYENMPVQIYWKFYHQKMKIFRYKNSNIFHISAQNIDWGYSLEPPRRGGSNEYPQLMLLSKNKKNNVNPSFTI